ncbi:MAG: class I tRNA ligase family protein [Nanoarchaeota archaeon]
MTKLWNSAKFTFDMLKDYDGKKPKKLASIDCWMLSKLQHTIQECTEHLDTYEFSKARAALEGFFWHTFCDNYIEIIKNRFYDDTRKETKHSAQYVLSTVLLDILKMFAPLLPFITEELYQIGFANSKKNQSIHVTDWPVLDKNLLDATIESQGDVFVDTLSMIRKFKSDHGKSLKADVDVTLSQKEFDLLNDMEDDFKAAAKIRHLTKGSFAVEFVS